MESASLIQDMVQEQLATIGDRRVQEQMSKVLVVPYATQRAWDYGAPGGSFTCWIVAEHRESNTGIAYCSQGFGARSPWGLLFLSGPHMSIGMDSGWFVSLEGAFRDSMAWDEPNPPQYEAD